MEKSKFIKNNNFKSSDLIIWGFLLEKNKMVRLDS
jgi:hypothetical protein|nr:MAG TPA: hypothetical protein [Caudoviricetes sp.]